MLRLGGRYGNGTSLTELSGDDGKNKGEETDEDDDGVLAL